MTNEPEQPAGASEPTQQFTQPYPTSSGAGGYPGPSGPPPSGNPWFFGDQTTTAPVSEPTPRRRGRAGLIGGLAALALVVGGGAGYGGAALWNNTHDDSSTSSIFSGSGSSGTSTKATAPSGSVQAVAQSVLPSVVKIEVAGSQESGSGSGIILTSDGTILTNNHVVEVAGQSGKIRVDFNDGTSADAKIVGTDPLTDTAIIKAQNVSNLKAASIGNSNDLAVGQSVVAIGSPFGLDSTVTSGIVSALNRPVNVGSDSSNNATVYPAIQTDAAINPGNSGGPLVDMSGKVVGINASIRSTTDTSSGEAGSIGLGFAIPMDEVKPVIEQMIKGETPTHARLGITVQDVGASQQSQQQQPDQGSPFDPFGQQQQQQQPDQGSTSPFTTNGAEVREVGSGSTAQKAGIKAGDIITKVDDQLIVGSDSLVATVRSYRPGDKVSVTYTRDGKTHTVHVTLDSDEGSTKS
ncbi:trypsin-like peptidase domain-containing protein [Nocardioides sp. CER19]|uniref:S1C family serine protease n=1 Tax=Nocardioides sp. CER19 TaxID=3038538 RepID=UPI002448652D|nr:trypsin-like peptidase domain-containing protein [Nocardioides sp. CER19]MDH2413544.1 trypsin-like peptidase domain-containing protein [Nocardioides sp. CER19]